MINFIIILFLLSNFILFIFIINFILSSLLSWRSVRGLSDIIMSYSYKRYYFHPDNSFISIDSLSTTCFDAKYY